MSDRTSPVTDPAVPAVAILLGSDADEFLESLVAEGGDTVASYRTIQVRYVPSRSVTVQFLVEIDRGDDAKPTQATIVAASGLDVPAGTATMQTADAAIAVWRFPHDPFLPGLVAATDRIRAGELLERVGAGGGEVRVRTRAYRAGRRAVVEANAPNGRVFMKVLRPDRVAALQEKHVELASHVPVPHSLGWSGELGIVALEAMPGITLRAAIEGGADTLPGPEELVELLDRIPASDGAAKVRGPWERAASHARTLHAVIPGASDQIAAIAAELSSTGIEEPTVGVHGDFHASQIMVDRSAVTGVVDVDTAGVGNRSDDLGNVLGHLATVATMSKAAASLQRYGGMLIRHFDTLTQPAALRRKVAATIFGLATGPFRVQEPNWPAATQRRLDLAERWLDSAADLSP